MNRSTLRLPLAALSLALLAGCVVNISFSLTRPVSFVAPGAGTRSDITQDFSILDSKEVADHKANIKTIDLEYADVTVTTPNVGQALVNATLKLQRTSGGSIQEVTLGTLSNFDLGTTSHNRFPGSPAIDAFLMAVLNGDGKFTAVVTGLSISNAANAVVTVDMHASIGYDAGIL